MKNTKKVMSVLLAAIMLITAVSVSFTAYASSQELCSKYATNPGGKVGVQKTITIDGSASDWSEDMLIAQGAAWDVANNYKGGHENCVLDTYALFAAWDSSNLYVGWQMVNTTDTWARSGDGPLSDGGRVLDVPLILALSVDPSSVSMSNKNTDGNSIWGQKMGVQFDVHVDHLLYMSGKPGLGEPSMFTAVDSKGNTNYTTGCKGFAKNGISYKMAETNICSSIWGLNGSKSTSDVYSDSANWVDFKTFKGSSGAHSTSYDSFYEIKIPLSTLGIDANYIANNGIGAMLVATRGESGLDCIPYDDTMLDNATKSYSSDPSTSMEKEDEDVITSALARIGKLDGSTPVVTTPVETQPVETQPVVTTPVTNDTTVTAKSNIATTQSVTLSSGSTDKTVSVKYELQASDKLCNGSWSLKYDTSKLRLKTSPSELSPNVSCTTNTYNNVIYGNFTDINLVDFTSSKAFVQAEFEVIGSGSAEVYLDVDELSTGVLSNGKVTYTNVIVGSVKQGSAFTATAQAILGTFPGGGSGSKFKVNATSNFFPSASQTFDASTSSVTVKFRLSTTFDVVNSQWELSYDPTKLSLSSANRKSMTPYVSGTTIQETTTGLVKGNFSDIDLVDFIDEDDFIRVTFDVLSPSDTTVNLKMNVLGIGYKESSNVREAYIVDKGAIQNVTGISGFSTEKYTTNTVITLGDAKIWGDVNGDGDVSISDATLIQRHCAGIVKLSDAQLAVADVDHNNDVTVNDATMIQKYLANIVTTLGL